MNTVLTNLTKFREQLAEQHCIIRKNPKAYIPLIEQQLKYFTGDVLKKPGQSVGIQTQEGKSAWLECIEFLKKQKPLGSLTLDDGLSRAAQDHADDIGPKGICGHDGSDGSSADDRISRYVDWELTICENIDFGATLAEEVIISLIVDDGVESRGHRNNIFNDNINFVGVGFAQHTEYGCTTVLNYCGGIAGYKSTMENNKPKAQIEVKPENDINNIKANNPVSRVDNPTPSVESQRKIWNEGILKNDPDKPSNAVGVNVKTVTKTVNGRTVKRTTKTYTLDDGSVETVDVQEEY